MHQVNAEWQGWSSQQLTASIQQLRSDPSHLSPMPPDSLEWGPHQAPPATVPKSGSFRKSGVKMWGEVLDFPFESERPKDLAAQFREVGFGGSVPNTVEVPMDEYNPLQNTLRMCLTLLSRDSWLDVALNNLLEILPRTEEGVVVDQTALDLLKLIIKDHGASNFRMTKRVADSLATTNVLLRDTVIKAVRAESRADGQKSRRGTTTAQVAPPLHLVPEQEWLKVRVNQPLSKTVFPVAQMDQLCAGVHQEHKS